MNKRMRIVYDFKKNKDSNSILNNIITSEDMEKYLEWAHEMYYDKGFNFPVKDLQKLLKVSWPWIDDHILEHCYSIRYLKAFSDANSSGFETNMVFVNRKEVAQYLKNISSFDRQSFLVEGFEFLGFSREEYIEDEELQDIIRSYFNKRQKELKINAYYMATHRTIYPRMPVEKYDFFNDMLKKDGNYGYIIANSSGFKSAEELYRYVILNGGIRIQLGNRKTIFAFEKKDFISDQRIPVVLSGLTENNRLEKIRGEIEAQRKAH